MKFSLVLATIGRTVELERFLTSLQNQTHSEFELIVVDQNSDERLVPILEPFRKRFPLLHLHAKTTGSSRARNLGIPFAAGDIVAFPDDDCWYGDVDLLDRVSSLLAKRPSLAGVTGRALDERGRACHLRWSAHGSPIGRSNVWRRAIEFTMFLRREVFEFVGDFDPDIGLPQSAGEGTDLLIRAVDAGFPLYYEPNVIVHHPKPVAAYDDRACRRAYNYSIGFGHTLRKHRYPLPVVTYHLARPAGAATLAFLGGQRDKARFYWAATRGKLSGWVG